MAFRLITENSAVLRYVNHSEIGPRPYRIAKCSRKGIVESGKHLDKTKELSKKTKASPVLSQRVALKTRTSRSVH